MRFRTILFCISAAAATFPCVVLGLLQYSSAQNELAKEETNRKQISLYVSDRLDAKLESSLRLISVAAEYFKEERHQQEKLSRHLDELRRSAPEILNIHFDDAEGRSVAFSPRFNDRGEPNFGISHNGRDHWKGAGSSDVTVSGLVHAVGATRSDIVNITKSVYEGSEFLGLAVAALDLRELSDSVLKDLPDDKFRIAIFDRRGREIFSSSAKGTGAVNLTSSELKVVTKGASAISINGFLGILQPLSRSDWLVGVFSSETDRAGVYKKLLFNNLIVWLFTACTAILFGYAASVSVARAVEKLSKQMQAGRSLPDKSERVRSPKEIVQLQVLYSRMQKKLNEATERLSQLNRSLEDKVQVQVDVIHKQESMLRVVFSDISEGVVLLNREGGILFSNKAAQAVLSDRSLKLDEVIEAAIANPFGKIFREHEKVIYELRALKIDKDDLVVVLMRDATSEVQIDKLKDELIGVAAHELKTPLSCIRLEAEYLRNNSDRDALKSSAQALLDEADEMKSLISRWLDVARLESGSYMIHRELCLIKPLISKALKRFLRQDDFSCEVSISEEAKAAFIDKQAFLQILLNLFSNADRYRSAERPCRVSLHAERREDRLVITIADNGIGMERADCEKVFDRFYQCRMDSARRISGTGLGLFITKRLAELHEGTISVRSTPGVGSVFTIELPIFLKPGGDNDEQHQTDSPDY